MKVVEFVISMNLNTSDQELLNKMRTKLPVPQDLFKQGDIVVDLGNRYFNGYGQIFYMDHISEVHIVPEDSELNISIHFEDFLAEIELGWWQFVDRDLFTSYEDLH